MSAITAEMAKLQKGITRIVAQSSANDEVPMRIHSRDIADDGSPAFHKDFLAYLEFTCRCPESGHLDGCGALRPPRFRTSNHKMHRHRLQRALRQLRFIAPAECDIATLIVKHGLSYDQARVRINEERNRRSQPSYGHDEFFVLTIAACSKLIASY